jgi:peroxiredoxin
MQLFHTRTLSIFLGLAFASGLATEAQAQVGQSDVPRADVPQAEPPQSDAKQEKEPSKKPQHLEVGDQVDRSLALKDIWGKKHRLADFENKTLVIVFYSIQCPYMVPALPKLKSIQKDYAERGVQLLAINSNKTEIGLHPQKPVEQKDGTMQVPYFAQVEHHKKHKVNFPVLVDHGNKVADLFRARTTPHCFVIDKQGKLRYAGGLDNDPRGKKDKDREAYVRNALDAVLAGEKVTKAETRRYGCSIKRVSKEENTGSDKRRKDKSKSDKAEHEQAR